MRLRVAVEGLAKRLAQPIWLAIQERVNERPPRSLVQVQCDLAEVTLHLVHNGHQRMSPTVAAESDILWAVGSDNQDVAAGEGTVPGGRAG